MEKISVAIRVRPPTKPECAKSFKWLVGQHSVTLYSLQGTPVSGQSFSFDHVFGTETKNVDIYGGLTKEVIMSTLNGFNGTVFAYGQTSSGKTYTMKGTPEDPGIIRLAVHDVFTRIQEICSREFLIRVSYMEIYNEEINDLFAPENRRLQIHENLEKGIFVAGLREEIVDSPEQVFQLLEFGESHRHFGETNMNLYSSRSHTIFRMVTESRGVTPDGKDADGNTDAVRNLVDLAGSERIAKTGAGGVRLKEGTHINKSLMTLGTVINKLSDGGGRSGGHIPYRDSKLTRILQPALGGNARTAMICTVTPDEIHVDETRGTLQFASRAKRVTNCAQVNEILTDAALLKRQTREIEDLRMKLQGLPQSEQEILSLRNELLKNEVEKERLFLELQEEKKAQADRERRLKEQELKIENLSTLFMSSTVDDRQLRKVNRRETWCPRQLKSHQCAEAIAPIIDGLGIQDFSWKEATKPAQDGTADCLLYSMRRDRRVDLPPEFDTLVDEESWNDSSVLNDPLPPSDFENIADEDTWMSLNKGHTTSSTVFTSDMFERSRSSGGSSDAERLAAMEIDLTKLQEKYRDLETNFEAKLDESRKDLRAEVHRTKSQLEEVLLTNARLNTELENTLKANAILSRTLSAQLESQKLLRRVIDDVECEMDAARLLTSSLQGLLVDALHGQALTVQKIHGCFPLLKKSPYKSQDARERKVLMEMSTQKCRDICADVDGAVQDILANVKVRSEGNLDDFQCDAEDEQNEVKSKENSRDPASTGLTPQLSSEGDPLYCRVCLPSLLPSVTSHDSAKSLESKVCHMGTCQCDLIAETHSRLMTLVRRSECAVDHLFRIGDGTRTHGKNLVGVSSSAPSEAHLKKYEVTNSLAPDSIAVSHHTVLRSDESETGYTVESWNSGSGLRCDHLPEVQGRTSGSCAGHVNADTAENQIARAMGNLCGQILKLVTPTVESCKPTTTIRVQDDAGPQDVTLEARLTSAKVLTAWLFEELRGILNHDIDCLKSHVKERSSFGLMLESLQILLLENASLAVILVQATCQDNCVVEQLISKLEALKEVYISPSLEPQATKADVLLEKLDQVRTSWTPTLLGASAKVPVWFFDDVFCQVGVKETHTDVSDCNVLGQVHPRYKRRLEFDKLQDVKRMVFKDIRSCGCMEPGLSRALYLEQGARGVGSVEGASLVCLQDNGSSTVQGTSGSSLDQGNGVSVEISQQDLIFCSRMQQSGSDEQASLIERLKMSREHIAALDRQLAVLCIEKDRLMKALVEELHGREEVFLNTKLQKVKLAGSLKSYMGEVAQHDAVLSTICLGIEKFEEELEKRRRNHTDRPLRIVQLAAPERQTFPAISRLEGPAETPSIPVPSRVMKLEGVEEMLGKLLQYFMGRLLNRENQVVNGITLLFAVTVVVRPMSTRPEESQGLEISVVRIEDEVNYCSQHDTMPTQTSAGVGDWIGIEVLKLICSESGSFAKSLDGDILNELCKAANVEEFLYRMSESYRQLRAQLAAEAERIKQLEYSLASSEMASVELKLELENLRARVQICEVTSEQGVDYNFELELEALKIRCENYEEEIRLIMEQVPTPDDDLRRDRLLADVRNENLYLRNCLVKANKRLAEVADAAVSCEGVGISCPVGPGVQDSVVNPEKHAEASVRDKEYIANTEDFVPSRLQVNSPRSGDDGRSDFDAYGCSDKRKPSYSVVKSGRLALGELELNRNNVAVPKRSRQQRASDYVLNKENLAVFR
ncbi:hypothetical protein R1sor_005097 [Riccia sorocarpa]|uniref:Kinesin motor domain-containing protein n=1 Tax=Riccia sorocarpa TaxID=122646 RepID=A0ABD3HKT3_9MARC